MAIAANIAIILCEVLGLVKSWKERSVRVFQYYTQLSNFVALAASIVFLLNGPGGVSMYLRYLAACMLTMTFLFTACILVPGGGGLKKLMFSGNGLYHHLIIPILSLISYICWEPHTDVWLFPSLTTLVYGVIMMILNGMGKVDGPYPFFRVRHQSPAATVLWTLLLFGIIAGSSRLIAKIA